MHEKQNILYQITKASLDPTAVESDCTTPRRLIIDVEEVESPMTVEFNIENWDDKCSTN